MLKTFYVLIGNAIEITSNAHGPEVLDDTLKATHSSDEDWPVRFRSRLADYLIRHNLTTSENAMGMHTLSSLLEKVFWLKNIPKKHLSKT